MRIAVVGPTATGKSDLALDLAERLGAAGRGAEIINADASQLYRGMDIGTAKVPVGQRRGVPHHQIDVLEVHEEANAASYQRHARQDLAAVEARGHLPIIVGGSGLYVRALTDDIDFPGTDPQVRAALEERSRTQGPAALRRELARRDPLAAQRIEAGDTRRIVRALEVIEITGRPFSASLPGHRDAAPTLHLALRPERQALNTRIDARARAMFEAGLLQEVEHLVGRGLRRGSTAPRAIGYSQALDLLDGLIDREEAIIRTAQATRTLASRQIKWFRRDPRVHWIDLAADSAADSAGDSAGAPPSRAAGRRALEAAMRLLNPLLAQRL
ncbi:tRNA (adenosine(37)-N6)-dimethylallyltransferase MiaA [Actinomyces bowdenii]|uniref:tRNA dimethylallyltransferase n=1 Tax=Actinomyces bowdenii TaxID=131109 RepID=A0A3P1V8F6_9ACTO|nr:tRNA (adenosine(37)-N6)-dimethylallyltransferase MiaA [Actinomyces bowdenii]RRD29780.1 tRNA (adenosine(37)-N6)-dimethylallyltransferase MiaA [Actinomyces bowdenii]